MAPFEQHKQEERFDGCSSRRLSSADHDIGHSLLPKWPIFLSNSAFAVIGPTEPTQPVMPTNIERII